MTDDDLAAIWERYRALHDLFEGVPTSYPDDRLTAARDVAALVGEIGRLRDALGEIANRDPATMEGAMLGVAARDALGRPGQP